MGNNYKSMIYKVEGEPRLKRQISPVGGTLFTYAKMPNPLLALETNTATCETFQYTLSLRSLRSNIAELGKI